MDLHGQRLLLRVDWNVPLGHALASEESVKIGQSVDAIRDLAKRGAITIVLTHLGRPEGRDPNFSTKQLVPLLKVRYRLPVQFHGEAVSKQIEHRKLLRTLDGAAPGSVHLLENVRFEKGEETNDRVLSQAYAALAHLYVNDAFASCHRAHASIAGITKWLPSYAGVDLVDEVAALSRLLEEPKRPFVAVIGGLKISTKMPVIRQLLSRCDKLLVGGAMATTILSAKGLAMGASFVETEALAQAKSLLVKKQLGLPEDVVVIRKRDQDPRARVVSVKALQFDDIAMDVGPSTLAAWAKEINAASTILWNGPVGVVEQAAFAGGSVALARMIAKRAGRAFTVVGGGDTVPLLFKKKIQRRFSHVSMGGGALLEFIAKQGRLPGLVPLME